VIFEIDYRESQAQTAAVLTVTAIDNQHRTSRRQFHFSADKQNPAQPLQKLISRPPLSGPWEPIRGLLSISMDFEFPCDQPPALRLHAEHNTRAA
jgi:hypothetical protein